VGPLSGVRVVEIAGLGPGPFGAMLLSDMGADVIRVDRADAARDVGTERPTDFVKLRGRPSIAVDLKQPAGPEVVLRLAEQADAFIEGFRPGVVDRLGIGPEACRGRNSRLVYAHATGWGQSGPLAHSPGHDINYLALSGLLDAIGPTGGGPVAPLNLVGDHAGGGALLAFGIVCGLLEASRSGRGQVIDAAMLDGAFLLGGVFHGLSQIGRWRPERGTNLLDGGAPFNGTYQTADGLWIAVGAFEPKFYATLLAGLGLDPAELPDQYDELAWPEMRERFAACFKQRSRAEWIEIMSGRDACFSPVLTLGESRDHPHNVTRRAFVGVDGVQQPVPAPRFDRTPGKVTRGAAAPGGDTRAALCAWGFTQEQVDALVADGTVVQRPS